MRHGRKMLAGRSRVNIAFVSWVITWLGRNRPIKNYGEKYAILFDAFGGFGFGTCRGGPNAWLTECTYVAHVFDADKLLVRHNNLFAFTSTNTISVA